MGISTTANNYVLPTNMYTSAITGNVLCYRQGALILYTDNNTT